MTYSLEREEHRWESETHATPHCSLANEMARAASTIFPPRVTGHQLALLKGVKATQRRSSIGLEDAPPRLSLAHGKQSKGRKRKREKRGHLDQKRSISPDSTRHSEIPSELLIVIAVSSSNQGRSYKLLPMTFLNSTTSSSFKLTNYPSR